MQLRTCSSTLAVDVGVGDVRVLLSSVCGADPVVFVVLGVGVGIECVRIVSLVARVAEFLASFVGGDEDGGMFWVLSLSLDDCDIVDALLRLRRLLDVCGIGAFRFFRCDCVHWLAPHPGFFVPEVVVWNGFSWRYFWLSVQFSVSASTNFCLSFLHGDMLNAFRYFLSFSFVRRERSSTSARLCSSFL